MDFNNKKILCVSDASSYKDLLVAIIKNGGLGDMDIKISIPEIKHNLSVLLKERSNFYDAYKNYNQLTDRIMDLCIIKEYIEKKEWEDKKNERYTTGN